MSDKPMEMHAHLWVSNPNDPPIDPIIEVDLIHFDTQPDLGGNDGYYQFGAAMNIDGKAYDLEVRLSDEVIDQIIALRKNR